MPPEFLSCFRSTVICGQQEIKAPQGHDTVDNAAQVLYLLKTVPLIRIWLNHEGCVLALDTQLRKMNGDLQEIKQYQTLSCPTFDIEELRECVSSRESVHLSKIRMLGGGQ